MKVVPAITRFEKTNATGMTSTNCLKTEITSDCGPALSAWYIPWKEILNPANKKLIETILMAAIQISSVSPASPNIFANGLAKISRSTVPSSMIADV